MDPLLPNRSPEALLRAVIDGPRRALPRLPETRRIARPGWFQIVTPSMKDGGMNDIEIEGLEESTADVALDEGISLYRDNGSRFRVFVWPGPHAEPTARRLEARGLVATTMHGMVRAIDPRALEAHTLPSITLDPVDDGSVVPYSETMAAGWEMDPGPILAMNRKVLADARASGDSTTTHWLASVDGVPAAVSASTRFDDVLYLFGAVVLPKFRGRGLYRAMVARRMVEAHRHGARLATTQARAGNLERLGFATVARISVFRG
ncbi:MAG: GNAT family N-acetyltransferase [Polyangiaceae bacterium]